MIASLMMYSRPQLRDAHIQFWQRIRNHLASAGIESPEHLTQDVDEMQVWRDPHLVLSQTCGMPYRLWLHDHVNLVGTPDYGLDGCPPGFYRSPIVVRTDDPRSKLQHFRDAVFAYNQTFSQSGYAAPHAHLKADGFWFETRLHTGAHLASALAVADGSADIAALDGVTWRLLCEHDALANQLRVLEWTHPTPGLPLITSKSNDPDTVFEAVSRAIAELPEVHRIALGLKGIVKIAKDRYLEVPSP